jgi:Leucine-rich repeat (LRR) protein
MAHHLGLCWGVFYGVAIAATIAVQIDYDLTGDNDTVIEEVGPSYDICDLCKCDEPDNLPLHIDCSSIGLEQVPESLENVGESRSVTVDFSYNIFSNIPGFPEIKIWEVDFSHNEIHSIDKYVFTNISNDLLHLDLGDNKIDAAGLDDDSFAKDLVEDDTLFVLIDLSLANNRIHSLPPAIFAQLGNLEDLDLSFNPLDEIDDSTATAIGSVASLHFLSLRECELSFLPG